MKAYGTLESPFDPDYLAEVLEQAGFVQIQQLLVVDELIDLADSKQALDRLAKQARRPGRNTLVAQNPAGPGEEAFAARLEAQGAPREEGDDVVDHPLDDQHRTVVLAGRSQVSVSRGDDLGRAVRGRGRRAHRAAARSVADIGSGRRIRAGRDSHPQGGARRPPRGVVRPRARRDCLVLRARLGALACRLPTPVVRIVVDVSPLSLQRTGIGNYLLGMLRGLSEALGEEDELVAFAIAGPRRKRVIEAALDGLPAEQRVVLVPPSAHTWRTAWSRLGRVPVERLAGNLDVFHFSDWMYPPQRAGLRSTTIYDLIPLHFPEWVAPLTRRMHGRKYQNAARTCDLVFAISRYTADDVATTLNIPRERIRVALPASMSGLARMVR